ncbi:MAG TPA: neutral zinc metallopeptidase [Kiloniellaceae bacterium]
MRWRGRRQSTNVQDRRSGGFGRRGIPLGIGRARLGRRSGIGGLGLLAVIVIALLLGVDPGLLLTGGQDPINSMPGTQPAQPSPADDRLRDFVAVVLADTEDVWHAVFQDRFGQPYEEPDLVLFAGGVDSACGFAGSAVGPFYCPGDSKIYLDLDFFRTLHERFGAPGDFAQAYVIAHEVGHHVQNLLGLSEQVRDAQQGRSETETNALSVMLELQADCLAGVWAQRADTNMQILEAGDIEEALGAASAIGDDTLQRQGRGRVTPDSFTHGTSAQRQRWFRQGLEAGNLDACNTFGAPAL